MNTNIIVIVLFVIVLMISGCVEATPKNPNIYVNDLTKEHIISTPVSIPMTTPYVSNIDDIWVRNFMSIINKERHKDVFVNEIWNSAILNTVAIERFKRMSKNPYISHYHVDLYNYGEEVLFPEGFSPDEFVNELKANAPVHWNGFMDPKIKNYGYHIENEKTLAIVQPCSVTEISKPNVDVKEYLKSHGCEYVEKTSTWLVIELE